MTLRKLPEPQGEWSYEMKPCLHPEHDPPTMVLLEPGIWEHCCPGCMRMLQFRVPEPPVCATWTGQ